MLWQSKNTSYVPTPVLLDDKFYWMDNRGVYHCADAKDGSLVHRSRVNLEKRGGHPVYASAIAINGLIYCQTRQNGLYVFRPSGKMETVARNQIAGDSSEFNATPAVDNGQLFLRSNKYLYCIQKESP